MNQHYLYDLVLSKQVVIDHFSTDQKLTYIITKSLGKEILVCRRDIIFIIQFECLNLIINISN